MFFPVELIPENSFVLHRQSSDSRLAVNGVLRRKLRAESGLPSQSGSLDDPDR
jgi:hypothetical protein